MNNHFIKNFDELATTPIRKDALEILEAGYDAISTEKVINSFVKIKDNILSIKNKKINLDNYKKIYFIGIGKCSADAGKVISQILGDRIFGGVIIDVKGVKLDRIQSHIGTHPLPSEENILATESIENILKKTTEDDLIITVISGGGSALLCLPNDIKCEMLIKITKELMDKGVDIEELNIVRKHLSLIQGGQFAKTAYPSEIVSLIFSDVPGNNISTIASGPTVMDTTTKETAEKILVKYNILTNYKLPDCEILETPKEEKYFEKVDNILLLTNETALSAMAEKARSLGYGASIVNTQIQGEARGTGEIIASASKPGMCMLYGGETTVVVRGNGKGGRSQELVLGALGNLKEDSVVVGAASDGWDNSDVAGAIGDRAFLEEANKKNLNISKFLDDNNSYEFFDIIGGHIKTGRIGSNVSDLYFTLTK